ncbi:MAG: sporulation integral membrane protein YtvI [Roseburia sp.]
MEREKKIQRQREFLIGFAYWTVWIAGALLALKFLGPVLLPFGVAFLVAAALAKPVDGIAKHIGVKRKAVSAVTVLLAYAVVGVAVYFLGYRIVKLAYESFLGAVSFLTETMLPAISRVAETVEHALAGWNESGARILGRESSGLLQQAGNVVDEMSKTLMEKISDVAVGIPGFCLKVLIAIIATVFMEMDYHEMMAFIAKQLPGNRCRVMADCKKNVMQMFGKCIASYVLILMLTFIELLVGLLLLRVDGALVIAFVIAVLDILPVLGTGTVLLPWGVIAIIVGDFGMGIGILVLYLVITVVRNIVEPKLVGKQIGLSPIVTLPCMLVGLKFFGIIGMVGGPLAAALLKNLNDQGVIRIFRK